MNWLTTPSLLIVLAAGGVLLLVLVAAAATVWWARRHGDRGAWIVAAIACVAAVGALAFAVAAVRAVTAPFPSNATLARAMPLHPHFRPHLRPDGPPNGFPALETTAERGVAPGTVTFTTSTTPRPTDSTVFHPSFIAEVDKDTGELVLAQRMFAMASMFQPESDDRYSYNVVDRNGRNGAGFHVSHYLTDEQLRVRTRFDLEDLAGGDADLHDFELLDNGNAMLLAYRRRAADLSAFGGAEDGIVYDPVIAERTPEGETVWQWDGADHLDLADVPPVNQEEKLTVQPPAVADYAHPNSLELFPDGDVLVSLRNYDCIYRIDRDSGAIVWTFGGRQCTDNDFTIRGDPLDGFSHQHDATILDNGHILLFDNGNLHDEPLSRVVEYAVDTDAMTADLVWAHDDGRYTPIMGSAQRLDDGNTLISWGDLHDRVITEVTPDRREVFSLSLPPGQRVYRAYQGGAPSG